MRRSQWDSKIKALMVMEGLKGRPIAEICNEHGIAQSMYYKWRDQFLSNASKVFDQPKQTQREILLVQENERLKSLVGELALELKKSEEVLG